MADWTERTNRPGGLGVPSVTEAPVTPAPPLGPPQETVDSDTGLPYAVGAGDAELDEVTPGHGPMEYGN